MNLFVFPYFFCQWYSRSQCHCGTVRKNSHLHQWKQENAPFVSKHWTDSQWSMIGNIVTIYHFLLRVCFLYWQDIALHIIARGFVMIKICVKAFYLALSALIGEMTDQHIWQKSLVWNCIVPKCQVQTLWQPFLSCTELQIRTHHDYASVV